MKRVKISNKYYEAYYNGKTYLLDGRSTDNYIIYKLISKDRSCKHKIGVGSTLDGCKRMIQHYEEYYC